MDAASESPVRTPPSDVGRLSCLAALAALLLLAAGLGLRWIEHTSTDLPPAPAIQGEFVAAAAAIEGVTWDAGGHDAGARMWTGAWVALNGQYDARLLATAALAMQVLAAGIVLLVLARRLPAGAFLSLIAIAAAMLAARGAAGLRPLGDAVWASALVALSMAQVALMTGRSGSWWRIGLGGVCGALNILAAPEGIAATATVVVWHALQVTCDRASWPARRGVLLSSGALFVGGIAMIVFSGSIDPLPQSFLRVLVAAFAWPLRSGMWVPVLWAPVVFCLIRVLRGDVRRAAVAPFALLALALTSVAGARCVQIGVAGHAVFLFGLTVNAACVVVWWCTSRRSAESRLVLGAIWLFTVFLGLMHGGAPREAAPVGSAQRDPATLALRRDVMAAEARWNDTRIRGVLPPSIRAPLAFGDESSSWHARVPELVGRNELPAVGTWSGDDASIVGAFTSAWMQTMFPLLEVRFSGTLNPPETAIVLRTADGVEIEPWTTSASAPARWKRLNFAAPRGLFQVIVRDSSAGAWIAATAPVEIGQLGWAARYVVSASPWVVLVGVCCGVGALAGSIGLAARVHAGWLGRGAPMFPWRFVPRLVLVACAVYCALNLDTTAGPNDSGGYLNSAKLLASGRIAAEPRMIFESGGADSDAGLHLPITFRVAPDGRIAPEYPVGLPLIIAAFALVLPMDAAVGASILLHLIMGVLLTRALARLSGLSDGWAWLAAAIIGLSPVYLFQGLQPMSDVPALAWVTAAVVWAWRSCGQPRYAVFAGIATALAVMIRPSNALCVVPVLLCLIGRWRQLAWWALAGLPGAVWLAWYQARLYGSPFATGYGDAGAMFGLKFLLPTLRAYGRWLPELFTPVVVLALAGPLMRGAPGRLRGVLAVWVALFAGFYSVYWCTWDTWFNMRFVLPAAPAMIVLSLLVLREVSRRLRLEPFTVESFWHGILPTGVLVCGVIVLLSGAGLSRRVLFWVHANHEHAVAAQWARDHLPADAVVFAKHASGSLTYYTDLTLVRADRDEAHGPEFFDAIASTGRPIRAVTYHWETRGFVWHEGDLGSGYPDLPGRWERLAALWDDHVFVWAWHPAASAKAD